MSKSCVIYCPEKSCHISGLRWKLHRAFLLQAAFISLAAVLGVYAAGFVIEEVLIKQALRDEARYFWDRYEQDSSFPLPNTLNLTGYMAGLQRSMPLPQPLRELSPGFHQLPTQADLSVVFVTEYANKRLYLIFDGERVGELALYFGLMPLAGVLMLLYFSVWLAYRISHRAISPVIWLAEEVHKLDPQSPHGAMLTLEGLPPGANQEVVALSQAISGFAERLSALVERERNFTRDASHELRSPLTVINIAADMLLGEQALSPPAQNSVARIKRAATDMEELTEAFLLLARESDQRLSVEPVCINDLIDEELERVRMVVGNKPVQVVMKADCRLIVEGSDKVLSVLIGNLIRNAFSYTDEGCVQIRVGQRHVHIEDSGPGMSKQAVDQLFRPFYRSHPRRRGGHGVGLTIVKRLSARFNWPVEIDSTPNVGTRAVVHFPEGRCEALEPQRPA